MGMKRFLGVFLLISLLLQSCLAPVTRDHRVRKMTIEDYMSSLVNSYYSDVLSNWSSYIKGGTTDSRYAFSQPEENVWVCQITDHNDDERGNKYTSCLTATIIIEGEFIRYQVEGYRDEEEDYRILITSPGGIIHQKGVMRAEIIHNGTPEGWCEAHLSPGSGYLDIEYASGEF